MISSMLRISAWSRTDGALRIANPIYQEVIPRDLTWTTQVRFRTIRLGILKKAISMWRSSSQLFRGFPGVLGTLG